MTTIMRSLSVEVGKVSRYIAERKCDTALKNVEKPFADVDSNIFDNIWEVSHGARV